MVPPVLCNSASAAPPYVPICFVFVIFCFVSLLVFFGPPSLPSFGSLLSSLAHQLDIEMAFFCFLALVSLPSSFLFFARLVYCLVLSCPCVGLSPGHNMELTVPAKSNLDPSGLGRRPERMLFSASFFFPFFVFFPFPFCLFPFLPFFESSFWGVRIIYIIAMFLVFFRCKRCVMAYHS